MTAVLGSAQVWEKRPGQRVPSPSWSPVTGASRALRSARTWRPVEFTQLPPRLDGVVQRVNELSKLPASWDSYGGKPLQPEINGVLLRLLEEMDKITQTTPAVSLTGEGGIELRWKSVEALLEIRVQPNRPEDPEVYYSERSGSEWEGTMTQCHADINKFAWQASLAE